jgi:glutamate synthase (NADPH/NADH) small chain
MTRKQVGDIAAGRLSAETLARNFDDVAPPLDRQNALLEAQRCYYCYDAPCTNACPTGIDIPAFIRGITTDNLRGAALEILGENIFGGSCARVCPTEVLCEQACVRNQDESKPVEIGALQRYATDWVYLEDEPLFERAPDSGRRVAIVGAGPAGLSCAHALARRGHRVSVFEAKPKPGGLNEYGIAAYKVPGFAQREVEWLLSIGNIEIHYNTGLVGGAGAPTGSPASTRSSVGGAEAPTGQSGLPPLPHPGFTLAQLRRDYDAVFLAMGLSGVNALGLEGENLPGVRNAVDFIAELRQAPDLTMLPVGRRVVVIGGGNTAIDAAVQSRKLGAESVTLVYRRGPESMSATAHEQRFAQTEGVTIMHWARPVRFIARDGVLGAIELEHTELDASGKLVGSDRFALEADWALKAIGQVLVPTWTTSGRPAASRDPAPSPGSTHEALDSGLRRNDPDGLRRNDREGPHGNDSEDEALHLRNGRIAVDEHFATSLPGVWAGGDCVGVKLDLTVQAVEDGKRAAAAIHAALGAKR